MNIRGRVLNRVIAKLIDGAVIVACGVLLPRVIGPFLGFLYSLLADGLHVGAMWKGQSVGKKLLKLRVVRIQGKDPIGFRESLIRNAPVGFPIFFAIIPVWGWAVSFFLAIPLFIIELTLMIRGERGSRLGDAMADTEVEDRDWTRDA